MQVKNNMELKAPDTHLAANNIFIHILFSKSLQSFLLIINLATFQKPVYFTVNYSKYQVL